MSREEKAFLDFLGITGRFSHFRNRIYRSVFGRGGRQDIFEERARPPLRSVVAEERALLRALEVSDRSWSDQYVDTRCVVSRDDVLRQKELSEILDDFVDYSDGERGQRRVSLSAQGLLESGVNTIVLGAAGSGKSTVLHRYAANRLRRSAGLTFYISASRMIHDWLAKETLDPAAPPQLESGLAAYLQARGTNVTGDTIKRAIEGTDIVLILDGLDEAASSSDWLLESMRVFAIRYPHAQVVSSARTMPRGHSEMPFLVSHLRPFELTDVTEFVDGWFRDRQKAAHLRAHLKENHMLLDAARSPLVCVILCVLEEYGVGLPQNEVRLHEERLRLLIGDYDLHKGVLRRTRFHRVELMRYCRRAAFALHSSVQREAELEWFYGIADSLFDDEGPYRGIVDELIYPCNILVPMSYSSLFGFGALPFQEHLAAMEILQDRTIEIGPLLKDQWWQGVLVLLAEASTSMDWILKEAEGLKEDRTARRTLDAMLAARPASERRRIADSIEGV